MKTTSTLAAAAVALAMATPALATDWTGFYGGVQLGYGDTYSGGSSAGDEFGGLQGGYNYDMGDWVVGGELEYRQPGSNLALGKYNESLALKGRVGYDFNGTLLYGTLGAARGSVDTGAGSLTDTGFVYGFGVERALSDQWSVGLEVLKTEYNNFGGSGNRLDDTSAAFKVNFRF